MARKLKICPICGKEKNFQWRQKTCSTECMIESRKRKQQTSDVGKCGACDRVLPLPYKVLGVRTCSLRCRGNAYARIYRTGRAYVYVKQEKGGTRACEQCGMHFECRTYNQKFCSNKCGDNWRYRHGKREKVAAKRASRQNRISGEIQCCALCGTETENLRLASEFGAAGRRISFCLYHRDHITPISHGGSDEQVNLRWLCWFCNLARSNMTKVDAAIAAAGRAFWLTTNT